MSWVWASVAHLSMLCILIWLFWLSTEVTVWACLVSLSIILFFPLSVILVFYIIRHSLPFSPSSFSIFVCLTFLHAQTHQLSQCQAHLTAVFSVFLRQQKGPGNYWPSDQMDGKFTLMVLQSHWVWFCISNLTAWFLRKLFFLFCLFLLFIWSMNPTQMFSN